MLSSLYIRDYALIDELEVDFSDGLNIITGETGTGKSILVGALKLILGERAATDSIRTGARKAVVEGMFDADDLSSVRTMLDEYDLEVRPSLILRREVSEGHSRAFINDSPASLQQLRAVASELVDLHGQHEHQSLLRPEKHLEVVDAFGGLGGMVDDYRSRYESVGHLAKERASLRAKESELRQQRESLAFQIQEIDAIAPIDGEEDSLDAERRLLENAERLFTATASLFEILYGSDSAVNDQLVRVRNGLQDLVRIDPQFDPLQSEIASAQIAVEEAAKSLQDYNSRIEFNQERLDQIRERLIELDHLKRRYGGTLEAVLAHREDIAADYEVAADFEGALGRLETAIASEQGELSRAANQLSARRREVAGRIESAIVAELAALGIPDGRFAIRIEHDIDDGGWISGDGHDARVRYEAYSTGMDRISFHLSTNPGEELKPLVKVASGGEISRIMLALKSILAKSDRLPILVFDEIDQGISGNMALKVGERLSSLARYHQIVAITHLPQVAALGDAHYKVEKTDDNERTSTVIRRLDGTERQKEIAGLLSGDRVTLASLESARELLDFKALAVSTEDRVSSERTPAAIEK